MARWSFLGSARNFVFSYYKQRKRGSKFTEHMCFSASAASVYLHREWLLQPRLAVYYCTPFGINHTHARAEALTEHRLSEEALRKQLWSRKDYFFGLVFFKKCERRSRLCERFKHFGHRNLNFSTLSLLSGVCFRGWLKALPLIVSICQSIVWMRSPITDVAPGQLDFSWFNWIYDMSQIQTSRDCFAVTASLLHIKNSFQNGLWLCAWQMLKRDEIQ